MLALPPPTQWLSICTGTIIHKTHQTLVYKDVKPPQWSVLTKICFPTGFIVVFVPNQVNGVGQKPVGKHLLQRFLFEHISISVNISIFLLPFKRNREIMLHSPVTEKKKTP